jgi:hypothetical protein
MAGAFAPADSAASSAIRVYRCQLLELYINPIKAATLVLNDESKRACPEPVAKPRDQRIRDSAESASNRKNIIKT